MFANDFCANSVLYFVLTLSFQARKRKKYAGGANDPVEVAAVKRVRTSTDSDDEDDD